MKKVSQIQRQMITSLTARYPLLKDWYGSRIRFVNKHAPSGNRRFFEKQATVDQIVELNQAGYNVYFVVNTSNASDKNTTKAKGNCSAERHITAVRYLFVDFDLGKQTEFATSDEFVKKMIVPFKLKPNLVIGSGNGIHVYWRTTDNFPLTSFKETQKRLIQHLGTDPQINDLPRIMRLPGSYNVKQGWDNRKLCTVLQHSPAVGPYRLRDFDRVLPKLKRGRPKSAISVDGLDLAGQLPVAFKNMLLLCPGIREYWWPRSPKWKTRSDDDFVLGLRLLQALVPIADIATIISPNIKAQSYQNRISREKYVRVTIGKLVNENTRGYSPMVFTTYDLHRGESGNNLHII
jgi:hypothetical protein